jgi:hypothetical protein
MDGSTFFPSGSFTSLNPGSYFVVVRDAVGCEEVFNLTIGTTTGPTIDSYSQTDVTCFEGEDGSVVVTGVSGGTGTLEYSFDGSPYSTSPSFTGLPAGTFDLVVKDAVDCFYSVEVTIDQPAEIVVIPTATNDSCFEGYTGTIEVDAAGGIGVLAYSIDGGETWQSSNFFDGLTEGLYNVAVKDAGECIGTSSIIILQAEPIVVSAGTTNVSCSGEDDGSIIVYAYGGTGDLEYSLNGGTYQVSPVFTGLDGGFYGVFVQDENGCVNGIDVIINEPAALVLSAVVYDVACAGGNDGVIDLTVSGGTAPYSFAWGLGQTTEDIFGMSAGTWGVTVTDFNGCAALGAYTIDDPDMPLVLNATVTNASSATSADGSIDITVTGGTSPYSYEWSNGETTADITDLLPGDYDVEVTDANGCVVTMNYTITAPLGLVEGPVDGNIKVYPNPATDNVTIEIEGFEVDQVTIVNLVGEVVYRQLPIDKKFNVNVGDLAPGMYFVQFQMGENSTTQRLVIN